MLSYIIFKEEHPIIQFLFYQVWLKLAQWFQIRSQIYEVYGQTTDDEFQVMAITDKDLQFR